MIENGSRALRVIWRGILLLVVIRLSLRGVINCPMGSKLVEARGQLAQAVPAGTGAMYAFIGLDDTKVIQTVIKAQLEDSEVVSLWILNSNQGKSLLLVPHWQLKVALNTVKENGAKRALPLSVSVPFTLRLNAAAADKFTELLYNIEFFTPKYQWSIT